MNYKRFYEKVNINHTFFVSVRSLLKLNKGNKIHLGGLKAIFVKVSQNCIKSHLKFCLISQISAHSLWHVWEMIDFSGEVRMLSFSCKFLFRCKQMVISKARITVFI